MNTKLLRQKILDLAIRGKLTDQRKSDGTAADLLKDIVEAKSKKNGVILSGARSAKSKDPEQIVPLDKSEVPFEIPENWEWVKLGDVVLNRDAERKPVSKKDRNLHAQKIYDYYGAAGAIDKVEEYLFDEKLLLIGEDGANLLSRSKPNAFLANGKYWVNNHAHVIDAIDKSMLDYLAFYINAISLDDFVTGTAQPKLNQQRIVAKIEEAFAEIDAIEKNKELLKTHIKQTRQKILDLAIHGKLVPQDKADGSARELLSVILSEAQSAKSKDLKHSGKPTADNPHYEKLRLDERRETKDERGFKDKCHSREGGNLLAPISKDEIPFDIPENWIWCRLGDILAPMQSTTPKGAFFKYIDIDAIDNSTCRIKAPKMIESKNAPSRASRFTKKGDILFSLVRPYLRNIAKVTENDCIASTGFFVCSPIIVNSDFCFFLLTSNYVVDGLNQFMKGDNSPSISSQNLIDFTIPLPPLNEQSRIVAKIDELFSTLDQMERNLV